MPSWIWIQVGNFVIPTEKKIGGLGDGTGQKNHAIIEAPLEYYFLPEKNLGLPESIFEKKIYMCDKGDNITRFDEFM